MKFAYADPPYLGQGAKLYGKYHPDAAVWDDPAEHQRLISQLMREYPDGWAMSASSTTLRTLLPMCPSDARVAAWVKPFCSFKPNVGLAYSWEPVILHGGRKIPRSQPTIRDHLDCLSEVIVLKKGLTGAKPPRFARWVFSMLNADPKEDSLDDLFPGSGIVGLEWLMWDGAPEKGGARA